MARLLARYRRALNQFLAVPLVVVMLFLVLSAVVYVADDAWSRGHVPTGFGWLGDLLGDNKALGSLLATIATSIITVTSITFSLLLIALQQGAAALSTQVTDQFLMRRSNQLFFGFFVGLSVYVLLTIVTVTDFHRPIFGTSVALVLTASALCMIVIMIYNTINQMRPGQIISAIHHHILRARDTEMALLATTRREQDPDFVGVHVLYAKSSGFVARFKVDALRRDLADLAIHDVEIILDVRIGSYLAFADPIARIRAIRSDAVDEAKLRGLADAIHQAIEIDDDRDLKGDPRYGIYQLSTIAWTSISTAKSNPAPGRAVINALRDIIARWNSVSHQTPEDVTSPIIYSDNSTMEAINALEMVILVASESIQAQTLTDAINTIRHLLHNAPRAVTERFADVVDRALSSLGEHVLTRDLELALAGLAEELICQGHGETAQRVNRATGRFAQTLGVLNSRSTRVPPD